MESYNEEKLRAALASIGYFLVYKETASSTIESALKLDDKHIPGAIIANHQMNGTGRYGHRWHDKKGSSVLITLVENEPFLRKLDLNLLAHLFLLSCCLTLVRITKNKSIRIKWPNDLVIGEKKLGGTLVDCKNKKGAVLISLGLNVQNAGVAHSSFLQSLSPEKIDRAYLIKIILTNWKKDGEIFAKRWQEKNLASYQKNWRSSSLLLGKEISLQRTDGQTLSGIVTDTPFGKGLALKSGNKTFRIAFNDYSPGSILTLKK